MPDQVVKTTLVVNANASGMKSIGEALDELISKAKELNDLLGGIKVGGGEGAGAGGKGGKGGASGGSSWDQPQPGGEGEGGATGGGTGRKRGRKGGASGGSTGDEGEGGEGEGPTDSEKQAKKNRQRLGYATAVGVGMLARSVKSHYTAYYEGTYGAQATEAAGAYSGDIYQQAITYRQAQAQREQAHLRHASGWAAVNIASSGAMLAGGAISMLQSPYAKVGGFGLAALGMLGGMWAGKNIAKQGAEIDTESAKQNAAINTLQRMQDTTMQLLTMQRNVIAFGARNMEQFSGVINAGAELGFTPLETQTMTNRYLSSGGTMYPDYAGVMRPREDFLRYQQNFNISPETMGKFETAFAPGGGAIPRAGYQSGTTTWEETNDNGMLMGRARNAAVNAARMAGVPQARMDEWLGRAGSYLRAGAERNVNVPPFSFTDTMSYLPTSVQGLARAAGTENMRNTGMSMADELGNLMMPQSLTRGLMMANIVGKGGGPADWQKQMTDPDAFAGNLADIYAQMPDMLKPFFVQSTSGLMGVEDFGWGKGPIPSEAEPTVPVGGEPIKPGDIPDIMALFAKQQKLYVESIDQATTYLNKFSIAIQQAMQNVEVYKDIVFRFPQ